MTRCFSVGAGSGRGTASTRSPLSEVMCSVPVTPALTLSPPLNSSDHSQCSTMTVRFQTSIVSPSLRHGHLIFFFFLISYSNSRWLPSSWLFNSSFYRCSSYSSSTSCLCSAKAFSQFSLGSPPFPSSPLLKVSVDYSEDTTHSVEIVGQRWWGVLCYILAHH